MFESFPKLRVRVAGRIISGLLVGCLLSAFGGAAHAEGLGPMVGEPVVAWGGVEIHVGDSRMQVRKVVGRQPDRAVPLYLAEHYPAGEQWMYVGAGGDDRLLWVEFIHGRVSRIWTDPIGEDGDGSGAVTKARNS